MKILGRIPCNRRMTAMLLTWRWGALFFFCMAFSFLSPGPVTVYICLDRFLFVGSSSVCWHVLAMCFVGYH